MSLHAGIDTVAVATLGVFSKTYGTAALKNRCNLYASYGMIEDAINININIMPMLMYYYLQLMEQN